MWLLEEYYCVRVCNTLITINILWKITSNRVLLKFEKNTTQRIEEKVINKQTTVRKCSVSQRCNRHKRTTQGRMLFLDWSDKKVRMLFVLNTLPTTLLFLLTLQANYYYNTSDEVTTKTKAAAARASYFTSSY